MSEIDVCAKCDRPFYVTEVTTGFGGSGEPEDVRCPHCGHTYQQRSEGYFQTATLSPDAEKEFLAKRTDN
jgi:predicted Zn finger-like uncharacterized protein